MSKFESVNVLPPQTTPLSLGMSSYDCNINLVQLCPFGATLNDNWAQLPMLVMHVLVAVGILPCFCYAAMFCCTSCSSSSSLPMLPRLIVLLYIYFSSYCLHPS